DAPPGQVAMKLAIVGRRNTGKSTFINQLAQDERMIVSEVPGTTRDSVDVRFERDGKVFVAIDTAGVRKKGKIQNDIEFYSLARGEFADYLHKVFPSLDYVPIAFITAKEGRNVHAVLNLAQNLFKQASARVGTGDLNRVLRQALADNPPPMRMNRRAKVFYAT